MIYPSWIVGGVSLLFGSYIIIIQLYVAIWQAWDRVNGRPLRRYSYAPLGEPLYFQVGAWLLPVYWLHRYAWVGWVLDPATWVLLLSLPFLVSQCWSCEAGGETPPE